VTTITYGVNLVPQLHQRVEADACQQKRRLQAQDAAQGAIEGCAKAAGDSTRLASKPDY